MSKQGLETIAFQTWMRKRDQTAQEEPLIRVSRIYVTISLFILSFAWKKMVFKQNKQQQKMRLFFIILMLNPDLS